MAENEDMFTERKGKKYFSINNDDLPQDTVTQIGILGMVGITKKMIIEEGVSVLLSKEDTQNRINRFKEKYLKGGE